MAENIRVTALIDGYFTPMSGVMDPNQKNPAVFPAGDSPKVPALQISLILPRQLRSTRCWALKRRGLVGVGVGSWLFGINFTTKHGLFFI